MRPGSKRTRDFIIALLMLLTGLCLVPSPWRRMIEPVVKGSSSFTVNTTGDGVDVNPGDGICATASGNCSLRAAIMEANALAGDDQINFNIPGAGVRTITPGSELPTITDSLAIDGYSQPGASPNTLAVGDNAVILIELNGTNAGATASGLTITGLASSIQGLAVNRFGGDGIELDSQGGSVVRGSFIGTNPAGTAAQNNKNVGIFVSSSNNTIGGNFVGARNVIAGNGVDLNNQDESGIELFTCSGNKVQNNYIGLSATGTAPIPNRKGVLIFGGANNLIGGPDTILRNVIAGNANAGIEIRGQAANGNQVQGNFIGTDVSGNNGIENLGAGILIQNAVNNVIGGDNPDLRNIISFNGGAGVQISSSSGNMVQDNFIGCTVSGAQVLGNFGSGVLIDTQSTNNLIGGGGDANEISGNQQRGVHITDSGTTGNKVQNNTIGTDLDGNLQLGNAQSGVLVDGGAAMNLIGGEITQGFNLGNFILFNGDRGVRIAGNNSIGNELLNNSIYANGNIGIDLGSDGLTPNDPADADSGPNNLQNFPLINIASTSGITTTVTGSLNSTPSSSFTIQIFSSPACDPSGNGEGKTFIGDFQVSTNASGQANFSHVFNGIAPGQVVTATATDAGKNTSEFSGCLLVTGTLLSDLQFEFPAFGVSEHIGLVSFYVERTDDTSSTVTVDYATSDGTADQRTDYTINSGTLTFGPGETFKPVTLLIVNDNYVEGDQALVVTLSHPSAGAVIGAQSFVNITIADDDTSPPTTNPLDTARFFVQQHYYDFLSRYPDQSGWDFWTGQITQCGGDPICIRTKRIDVSNSFFYELEYQQTGAYVFRLYRAAYGNNQPFPNPDSSNQTESKKLPAYAVFARDRARVVGGTDLTQGQRDLANAFVQRSEFVARYPASQDGPTFVDAVLANLRNDTGVDLTSQRTALLNLFNTGGRGAVMYRLADENLQTNPINNRAFIDEEYNRAFVATEYFGYLRRDADIAGFLFWLGQVNSGALRDTNKQHAMVCSFITSMEYQQRFSPVVTHGNGECQ